jgi:TPP-dependent pyruvate/acetoin dehydrogenase alpha subunit
LFPIVLARYLRADDYVISNHRGHGHYLSVTGDFEGLIAEVMGRRSGASGDMVAVNTSGTRGSTRTEFRAA